MKTITILTIIAAVALMAIAVGAVIMTNQTPKVPQVVTGHIKNINTGAPLGGYGVTVTTSDASAGAIVDQNGDYNLTINTGDKTHRMTVVDTQGNIKYDRSNLPFDPAHTGETVHSFALQ